MAAQLEYLEHVNDQYLDRTVYWSLRQASCQHQGVLCLIHDGMDRSKFKLPRWPGVFKLEAPT